MVGWQGIRFQLPPEWNVSGFSMDRDNGYLRVDAPGSSSLTVQIRWTNAAKPQQEGPPTAYSLSRAARCAKWLRRPEPPVPKTDLKANLEKMFKETAKQAKKAKAAFESSIKPEKTEGADGRAHRDQLLLDRRRARTGQDLALQHLPPHRDRAGGRAGEGSGARSRAMASQLFATLQDHRTDGYDLWALYDLQIGIPDDFRLEEQKLLSGLSASDASGAAARRSWWTAGDWRT